MPCSNIVHLLSLGDDLIITERGHHHATTD
nr:MAG TPA: hypothetical protein [Caudoviricetes sp.]